MKLIAELDGERSELKLERDGERVEFEIEGRGYTLAAHKLGDGEYLILNEGRVYECRVARPPGSSDAGALQVTVGRRGYSVALADPKRLSVERGAARHDGGGRAQLSAAMPGKVVRVLVERGQEVEAGQGVLVVEAMKMQNEMKSPKAGVVVELQAVEGATVNAGEVLAVIE